MSRLCLACRLLVSRPVQAFGVDRLSWRAQKYTQISPGRQKEAARWGPTGPQGRFARTEVVSSAGFAYTRPVRHNRKFMCRVSLETPGCHRDSAETGTAARRRPTAKRSLRNCAISYGTRSCRSARFIDACLAKRAWIPPACANRTQLSCSAYSTALTTVPSCTASR